MKSHDTNGGSGLASSSQRIGEPDPTAPCREDDAPAVLNAVAPSRLLFDHAPDAILVADVHGHYVDANLSALALLGYSRKELLQLSVGDVVANGPLWAAEEYARFVREAQWQGEVTLRAKDGRLVPAEAHAVVIPWIEGDAYVSFLRDLTERHRHHAVQARLAALVTSTGDAVMSETVDGIITDWNPAAESLFGYTASEVLGHPVAILAPPDRAQEIDDLLAQVREGAMVRGHETVHRTKDGRLLDVSVTLSPVRDEAGRTIGVSAITRDISTLKAAECTLAGREALYRSLVEQLPAVIYTEPRLFDPEAKPTYMSPSVEALLGYPAQAFLDVDNLWAQRIHPEDQPWVLASAMHTNATGTPFHEEYRMLTADGRAVWVHDTAVQVRDASGTPVCWQGVALDVSERKAAAEELAATHQRTREVLERITDGFYAFDGNWRFTYVNETAELVLNRRRGDLLGKVVWEEFPEAVENPVHDAYQRAMREGVPTHVEFFYPPLEGWYEARAYPSLEGLSVFFTDITERKQAEVALREALAAAESANRATRQFQTTMSHELRTPMQAIMGYAELLLRGPEGSLTPEQTEDIRTIQQAASRLVALVKQMLDLARLEAGQMELVAKPVNVAEILRGVRGNVLPMAMQKCLTLQIDLPPQPPSVWADPMALYQIMLNLVGNAVKFTEAGHVRLSVEATEPEVVVAVQDTGIGIVQEALPRIFDEFQQADGGVTRRYEGAGLGLSIVKKLAELMGGRITVESEPGRGSTFRLHLPHQP